MIDAELFYLTFNKPACFGDGYLNRPLKQRL